MRKIIRIVGKMLLSIIVLLIVLSLWMYSRTKGDYSVAQTVQQDPGIPHLEANNAVFHLETYGQDTNDVVIIIHGGPGNDFCYLLPLKPLSKDYFVIFYDQRGTGLSPRVDKEEHSLEHYLSDLDAIVTYFAPNRKVNIVGHSWGAMLATGYIAQHPGKVNKAVLAEPGMLTTEKAKEFMQKVEIRPGLKAIGKMITFTFQSLHIKNAGKQARRDFVFSKILSLNIPDNPFLQYFCGADINNAYLPFWRYSAVAQKSIMEKRMNEDGHIELDLVSGLENFQNKVLFISGECNQLTGENYQQEHMNHFRNAEMVVINDAGHTMFGEKPYRCLEIIRNYFKE